MPICWTFMLHVCEHFCSCRVSHVACCKSRVWTWAKYYDSFLCISDISSIMTNMVIRLLPCLFHVQSILAQPTFLISWPMHIVWQCQFLCHWDQNLSRPKISETIIAMFPCGIWPFTSWLWLMIIHRYVWHHWPSVKSKLCVLWYAHSFFSFLFIFVSVA